MSARAPYSVSVLVVMAALVAMVTRADESCLNYINGEEVTIMCDDTCCLDGSYSLSLSESEVCSDSDGCQNTPAIPTSCPIVVDGEREMYGCGLGEICCFANLTDILHFTYTPPYPQDVCSVQGVCYGDGYSDDEYGDDDEYDDEDGDSDNQQDDDDDMPLWIIILLALAIFLILGMAVLLFGLFCYRYSKRPVHPAPTRVSPIEEGNEQRRLRRQRELEEYLIVAISARNITDLKLVILAVKREGFRGELGKKYQQAQELLEELIRIRMLDEYLTVAIKARDMAELKLAIHMVEKEQFERVLYKKYRQAQDLFQELMSREDAERKREIEEAERQAALAKKELEEAEAEARRREADNQDAEKAQEAIKARDAAQARWGKLWPRLNVLKALNDVSATAVDKAMEEARKQREEEERLRREAEEKAKMVKYCQEFLQHGIDAQDEGDLKTAIKNTQDRNLQEDKAVAELYKKAQTDLEKLREERIRREAEEEAKRQAASAEEEAKRQAALAEEEAKRQVDLAKEEAKRQADFAKEEAKRQADLAEAEANRKAAEAKRLASLAELNQIRDALQAAIKKRDIGKLKKCLREADDKHLQEDLKPDYEIGKHLLERLEKMEVVKRKIMEMDRPLIAELKSFSEPPVPVYRAMVGSYLLMGESKSSLKDWNNIVILLNKTGKLSVKRRVQELNLETVKEETAKAAENQILGLTSEEVYEANQAASLFFDWAEMICYERKYLAESTH